MSVKDLIKKSVLELDMFKNSFTPEKILQMVIALGVALLMGLVICFIYNRFSAAWCTTAPSPSPWWA